MTRKRPPIAAWLRRRFRLGKVAGDVAAPAPPAVAPARPQPPAAGVAPPEAPAAQAGPARLAALRGLGERSAPAAGDQAAEAELDTLRGELVRELDRMAEGDDGSGSFRRIAS